MADTKITPESTLQEVLNYQYGTAGGSLRSIIIRNRSGECTVEPNTNVRFYNCTFSSFKSTKNNTFFFRNCTFEGNSTNFDIEGASIIADQNTTFKTKVRFKDTSLQLLENTIQATQVYENVQLFSYNCTWEPSSSSSDKAVGISADNSRLLFLGDTFSKWEEYFLKAIGKTYIKIDKPSLINTDSKPFLYLKDSAAEVWNIKKINDITSGDENTGFIKLENSQFLLNSETIFRTNSIYFDALTSYINIEKATKLISTNNSFFKTKNSTVQLNNLEQISSSSESKALFNSSGEENYFLSSVKELKSISKLFAFETINLRLMGDNTTIIQSEKDVTFTGEGKSTILINNVDTIKAVNSSIFNLKNTILDVSNTKTVEAGSRQGYVLSSSNGSSIFSNINTIKSAGSDTMRVENQSNLTLLNVQEVTGTQENVLKALSNSKILCKKINSITGSTGCLYLENSSIILKDIPTIKGDTLIDGSNSKVTIVNVETLDGDISGTNIEVKIVNTNPTGSSTVKDINLVNNSSSMKEIVFEGPVTLGKGYFENYIIRGKNVKWTDDVTLVNSIFLENINSSLQNLTLTNSILSNIKSTTGNITGDKSVVELTKGSATDISLTTGSSVIGKSTSISDITITDGAGLLAASTPSTVALSGKSSLVGIGLNNLAATFSSGDPSITGVGFFINSGGNLGLQADNEILEESNYLREKLRSEIVETAVTKISSTVGSTSVTIEPTQILEVATTKISSTVSSSSIVTETSQITLTTSALIKLKATAEITLEANTVNI